MKSTVLKDRIELYLSGGAVLKYIWYSKLRISFSFKNLKQF